MLAALFELADVMLRIKLDAKLGDEIELLLEEIDVLFLVVHQLLEQVAGDVVLDRMDRGVEQCGAAFRARNVF